MNIYPNNSNHTFFVMQTAHVYCGLRNCFFNITEINFRLHTVDFFTNKPPVLWMPAALSQDVMWPVYEADHFCPCGVEVMVCIGTVVPFVL